MLCSNTQIVACNIHHWVMGAIGLIGDVILIMHTKHYIQDTKHKHGQSIYYFGIDWLSMVYLDVSMHTVVRDCHNESCFSPVIIAFGKPFFYSLELSFPFNIFSISCTFSRFWTTTNARRILKCMSGYYLL